MENNLNDNLGINFNHDYVANKVIIHDPLQSGADELRILIYEERTYLWTADLPGRCLG